MQACSRPASNRVATFQASREKFEALVEWLESGVGKGLTHGDLESKLERDGRELLRQLLQDHLDLRGPGETDERVVGVDGVPRTHRRLQTRTLETIFGTVAITRMGYGGRHLESLRPLDVELHLPDTRFSHGVEKRLAEAVVHRSFDAATALLEQTTGAQVAKRQTEEVVARAAVDFDEFYATRSVAAPVGTSAGGILVLGFDGKGVRMRKEHLREATRRKRGDRPSKLKRRLAKGEKHGQKRMAQVATVYTIEPLIRKPDEIVREFDRKLAVARPRPQAKRVWASVAEPAEAVIDAGFREALRRDPERQKRWVVVLDGNRTQLKYVQQAAEDHDVQAEIVLDIFHVTEYLWRAVPGFAQEGSPEAEAWVEERLLRILEGKVSQVAAGIRRSATARGLTGWARRSADKAADYLLSNAPFMNYHRYLAAGLPIASGAVEGACRHLVNDRLDFTGARWSVAGADAVLRLRSLWASGDLDDYWAFHERREFQRNHRSRFAGTPPRPRQHPSPAAARPHLRAI
jgi:hypothetical protein